MLRRYLIVNGVSSAVFYAGIWAFIPSLNSVTQVISDTWETYVMGHTFLGPVVHRIVTVGADVIGVI
jgi:hypothetical protein